MDGRTVKRSRGDSETQDSSDGAATPAHTPTHPTPHTAHYDIFCYHHSTVNYHYTPPKFPSQH